MIDVLEFVLVELSLIVCAIVNELLPFEFVVAGEDRITLGVKLDNVNVCNVGDAELVPVVVVVVLVEFCCVKHICIPPPVEAYKLKIKIFTCIKLVLKKKKRN